MTPEEARRQAILKFGPVEAIKESYRAHRGVPVVDAIVQDLRGGLRMLRRRPAFSLVVVTTLALGIGANAAIFSVVDAILLRPLPYPEALRIVEIRGRSPQPFTRFGSNQFGISPPELLDSPAFDAMALSMTGGINLGGSPAERIRVAAVTERFFAVLAVEARVGRPFDAGSVAETRQLAVLSHRLWQRRFAGDPAVVGGTIRLNERPYLVVAVMPPRVDYPAATEVWIPNGADFQIGGRAHSTTLVARLADGITAMQTRDEVNRLVSSARPGGSTVTPRGVTGRSGPAEDPVREVVPLRRALVGDARPVFLLMDLGARGDDALTFELSLPEESYGSREELLAFYERFADALASVPGIEAFGATDQLPGEPDPLVVGTLVGVEGRDWQPAGEHRWADDFTATPGYFEAIGIDVVAGRTFLPSDRLGAPPVVVVSEGFAHALGVDAADLLGEQLNTSSFGSARYAEIIGVVRDVRLRGPDDRFKAAVYQSFAQHPNERYLRRVVVKSKTAPQALAVGIRDAVAAIAPGLPLDRFRTFDEVMAVHFQERRLAMATMLAFGGLALLLATAGLYAVLAYLVRLRRPEIGIRLAIGAAPSRVRREVLGSGMRHALTGSILGVVVCSAIWRIVATAIPGIGALDLRTAALVACSVVAVSLVATWVPAARATRVDPVSVLRSE
jgi:hypothetical protein